MSTIAHSTLPFVLRSLGLSKIIVVSGLVPIQYRQTIFNAFSNTSRESDNPYVSP